MTFGRLLKEAGLTILNVQGGDFEIELGMPVTYAEEADERNMDRISVVKTDAGTVVAAGRKEALVGETAEPVCEALQKAQFRLLMREPAGHNESLLDQLLEGNYRAKRSQEVLSRELGLMPGKRYRIIRVTGNDDREDIGALYSLLSQEIGSIAAGTKRKKEIVFLQHADTDAEPDVQNRLLLTAADAHRVELSVSRSAVRPRTIPTLYRQACAAARFGRAAAADKDRDELGGKRGGHVFFYDSYMFYQVCETLQEYGEEKTGNSELMYFCEPSLGRLLRYDREHGTSLMDFLRCYLRCGCNASKTAEKLYMHRNTALSRVDRIKTILKRDLEDPEYCERMIFSFWILDYSSDYLKTEVF